MFPSFKKREIHQPNEEESRLLHEKRDSFSFSPNSLSSRSSSSSSSSSPSFLPPQAFKFLLFLLFCAIVSGCVFAAVHFGKQYGVINKNPSSVADSSFYSSPYASSPSSSFSALSASSFAQDKANKLNPYYIPPSASSSSSAFRKISSSSSTSSLKEHQITGYSHLDPSSKSKSVGGGLVMDLDQKK